MTVHHTKSYEWDGGGGGVCMCVYQTDILKGPQKHEIGIIIMTTGRCMLHVYPIIPSPSPIPIASTPIANNIILHNNQTIHLANTNEIHTHNLCMSLFFWFVWFLLFVRRVVAEI